jgi:hypothetical protein
LYIQCIEVVYITAIYGEDLSEDVHFDYKKQMPFRPHTCKQH